MLLARLLHCSKLQQQPSCELSINCWLFTVCTRPRGGSQLAMHILTSQQLLKLGLQLNCWIAHGPDCSVKALVGTNLQLQALDSRRATVVNQLLCL